LFQSTLERSRSPFFTASGVDGRVDKDGTAHKWLNAVNAPQWWELQDPIEEGKFEILRCDSPDRRQYPCTNQLERFGTEWAKDIFLDTTLVVTEMLTMNGISDLYSDAPTDHSTHGAGLSIDVDIDETALWADIAIAQVINGRDLIPPAGQEDSWYRAQLSSEEEQIVTEILAFIRVGTKVTGLRPRIIVGGAENATRTVTVPPLVSVTIDISYPWIRKALQIALKDQNFGCSQTQEVDCGNPHWHHFHVDVKPPNRGDPKPMKETTYVR
jgi:hypothetical protein